MVQHINENLTRFIMKKNPVVSHCSYFQGNKLHMQYK